MALKVPTTRFAVNRKTQKNGSTTVLFFNNLIAILGCLNNLV
jgi:hypothetical protein